MDDMIGALFFAFILAAFGFDIVVVNALNELFSLETTTNAYYFIFACAGLLHSLLKRKEC
jgi:hypothetical protein